MSGHQLDTDTLIGKLTADLQPRAPERALPRGLRVAALLSLYALGTLFALGLVVGRSLPAFFASGPARVAMLGGLVLGAVATLCALLSSIPGRAPRASLVFGLLGAWLVLLLAPAWAESSLGLEVGGLDCSLIVAGLSLLPGILLARAIAPLAPTRPLLTGALAGVAAAAFASTGLALFCPNHHPGHLALYHIALPAVSAALTAAGLARARLRW